MRERFRRHPLTRAMAVLTVTALVQTSVPVWAAEEPPAPPSSTPTPAEPAPPPAPPAVEVNRKVPAVGVPPAFPRFSPDASSAEIRAARVFGEPLVPLGGTPSPEENRALAQALTAALGRSDIAQRLAILENFLAVWPDSAWRASLLANLGVLYRRHGYFTRAENALTRAWDLAKNSPEPPAQAVAGTALAELLDLNMRFGRVQPLEALLAQVQDRVFLGSPVERIREARAAVWMLRNQHHRAIPSGPRALARIQAALQPGSKPSPEIDAFHADEDGATLLEMSQLAKRSGLKLRPAVRGKAADIPLPAVMHFKIGHFSALLKREGNHYLIDDTCLGGEVWISAEALEEESSGYFLIAQDGLPKGWREASEAEMEKVRGKCAIANPAGESTAMCSTMTGSGSSNGCAGGLCPSKTPPPLATYSFHTLLASVHIEDTPVAYAPPRGPAVAALVTYNQRESFKPLTYTFTNLGSRWNLAWVAWVEDDPTNLSGPAYVHMAGGGRQTGTGFSGSSYAPDRDTQAVLTRTSTSPIRYERLSPDGSVEVYAQADGASSSPRRIFLTEKRDPQGNALTFTYDAQLRLAAVTDPIGQVTTLSYELIADPLKLTRITDPFGRFALFEYDGTGRLISITDPIGMKSQFQYGPGDFIGALTTPYGTTTFSWRYGNNPMADFGVEAVDPLGGRERIEWLTVAPLPATDPAGSVPPGFSDRNTGLNLNSTYYWDKRAMALFPGDPSKAQITKWNFGVMGYWDSVSTFKMPLEGRVWYSYPNQPNPGHYVGPLDKPIRVGRVLDDGQAQVYQYEYNARGRITKYTDPLGRETRTTWGTGSTPDADPGTGTGIDLLKVEQKNGIPYDLLWNTTYNGQHRPLTITDSGGQTTSYTYLPDGRLETEVTPPRTGLQPGEATPRLLTVAERTRTYSYYPDNAPTGAGQVQTITEPSTPQGSPATTFTYDGFGRMRTETDQENYALTYDYDALDRLTRTSYPDGTYEETVYNRLDAEAERDRLGRWSRTFHDALRRVTTERDPLGRTVTLQWCTCGSLEKLIDANGNATTWERDVQGRITRELRPDSTAWEYTYENTTERLKQRRDPKNQTTIYDYFLDNSLKQTSYANAEHSTPNVSITYDPSFLRPQTMTDGTGSTSFGYHPIATPPQPGAGRLASLDGPLSGDTDKITFNYDELGRVVRREINGSANITTEAFDALHRLRSETNALGTFGYAYDGVADRLKTVTYPLPNGQTTVLDYLDNLGDHRLKEIHHKRSGGATLSKLNYTIDVAGNVRTWTQQAEGGPAQVYEYILDFSDRLTSAVLKNTAQPPTILKSYGYGYDEAGNRTAEAVDQSVATTAYSTSNRLQSQQSGGPLRFAGAVSEVATVTVAGEAARVSADNRYEGTAAVSAGTNTVAVTATDPSGNARTNTYQVSVSGSTGSFAHDANGNLTGDGARTYEWDAENRLVAVIQGSRRSEFTYNGLGQRVRIIEKEGPTVLSDRHYVWCGLAICDERDFGGTSVIRRFFGQGMQGGSAAYFYTRDHLGSIRELTDVSGVVRARYDYDPYGRQTKVSGDRDALFGFTGHFTHSPSGLILAPFRAYSASLGRWISEDPIGLMGGPNLYAYVENGPINQIDPLGLVDVLWHAAQFAAGAGDNLSFGLTSRIRDAMGTNDVIDKCSAIYSAGEWTGVILSTATGAAGGLKAAGARGMGREFSHFIPNRILKRTGSPSLGKSFGRSRMNGNFVTPTRHFKHDPFRFPPGWRNMGPRFNPIVQKMDRIPRAPAGTAAGAAWGGASMLANRCECK